MKNFGIQILALLTLTLGFSACDDSIGELGTDLMYHNDAISDTMITFQSQTRTIRMAADKIVSNTNDCFIGSLRDPLTGITTTSDFLAQYNAVEDFSFPQGITLDSVDVVLYINKCVGDTMANHKIEVYELSSTLEENETYYANQDPTPFVGTASPLALYEGHPVKSKVQSSYVAYYDTMRIKLPIEFGERIVQAYRNNPANFRDGYSFTHNVLKGFYMKHTGGEGSLLQLYVSAIHFYYKNDGQPDVRRIAATGEVIQLTRSNNDLTDLFVEDANTKDSTYLYSPAGMATEISVDLDSLQMYCNDLHYYINNVRLSFESPSVVDSAQMVPPPSNVLLMPKSQMYSFFEKSSMYDNSTTFLGTLGVSGANRYYYSFANVADLILALMAEKKQGGEGTAVLVPIGTSTVTTGTSTTVYGVHNQYGLSSLRLKRNPQVNVIFSHYGN